MDLPKIESRAEIAFIVNQITSDYSFIGAECRQLFVGNYYAVNLDGTEIIPNKWRLYSPSHYGEAYYYVESCDAAFVVGIHHETGRFTMLDRSANYPAVCRGRLNSTEEIRTEISTTRPILVPITTEAPSTLPTVTTSVVTKSNPNVDLHSLVKMLHETRQTTKTEPRTGVDQSHHFTIFWTIVVLNFLVIVACFSYKKFHRVPHTPSPDVPEVTFQSILDQESMNPSHVNIYNQPLINPFSHQQDNVSLSGDKIYESVQRREEITHQ